MEMKKIGVFVEDEWVATSYFAILGELRRADILPLLITTNREWDGGLRKSIPTKTNEPIYYLQTDLSVTEVNIDDFAGFIFGGGYWADRLRWWLMKKDDNGQLERPEPKALIEKILASESHLIGAICHSMWILCSLNESVKGKEVTCAYNIIDDVLHAGFKYIDRDVNVDGNLVTGRMSDNSDVFIKEYIAQLKTKC